MTWSQLDVEAAIMLLTAAAIAYSAMQFIFLRGRYRPTEIVRKQGQALRRAGARSIGKDYGPGLGVAAILAALLVSVPSRLSSGIALSILVGAVGAFLLMLLAVVAGVGTFLSVTHDLERERPIHARSEPVVAASAFGCAILAGVFGMLLAVYLASNGNVADLVGAQPLLQQERRTERPLHRDLLVEQHPEQDRERLLREELVGRRIGREVQRRRLSRHNSEDTTRPCGYELRSAPGH